MSSCNELCTDTFSCCAVCLSPSLPCNTFSSVFLAESSGPVVPFDTSVGFSSSSCDTLGCLEVSVLVASSLEESNLLAFSSSTLYSSLVQWVVTLALLNTLSNSCVSDTSSVDDGLSLGAEISRPCEIDTSLVGSLSESKTNSSSLGAVSSVFVSNSCADFLVSDTSSGEPGCSLDTESLLCSACSPSLACVFNTSGGVSSTIFVSDDSPFVATTSSVLDALLGEPNLVGCADSSVSSANSESLNGGVTFVEASVGVETLLETFQCRDATGCTFLWSDEDFLSEDKADKC